MSQGEQWNADNAGEDVQMPLGVGDSSGVPEPGLTDGAKPKVNSSTIALFAAFAAALVALYLLGLQNKPRQANAQQMSNEAQVADAIAQMLNSDGAAKIEKVTDDKIVRLYRILTAKPQAVESEELSRNPFELEIARSAPQPGLPTPAVIANDSDGPTMRLVAEEFGQLKLQTVMLGSQKVAMINNQMLTVGSAASEHLKLTDIQSDHVVLAYKENKFSLKLSAPKNGS